VCVVPLHFPIAFDRNFGAFPTKILLTKVGFCIKKVIFKKGKKVLAHLHGVDPVKLNFKAAICCWVRQKNMK